MTNDRRALIAWAALAEPCDLIASWLVDTLGAAEALEWLRSAARDPVSATHALAPHADARSIDAAVKAVGRFTARLDACDGVDHERRAEAVGARIVTRVDAHWPRCLDDLADLRPYALWVRGAGDPAELLERSIAIVGSRASTSYGEYAAASLAGGVGDEGWCVVSGGAYGIDGAAHRAALTSRTPTVAVMAGGVDRLYPAGHSDLLEAIARTGAIIAEVPVGSAPHRSRFLARNRLIAAASATCVVEAAARSGALSTARHALTIGRPLAAVPGPITSVASAGCHGLIRDGLATLVTSAAELAELAGPIGADEERVNGGDSFGDPSQRKVFDAIAARGSSTDDIARGAGLTIAETLGALTALEASGRALSDRGRWRRASSGEQKNGQNTPKPPTNA